MNIEALRQHLVAQVTTVELNGQAWRIAKLGIVDGFAVNDFLQAMPTTGEGDEKQPTKPEDLVRLYSLLLSKSVVDEQGKKTLDSEEGRELLGCLSRDELLFLGDAAMDWCCATQKKS
jgi:hypothetical protein